MKLWQEIVGGFVVGFVLVMSGYWAGRTHAPAKVVEKTIDVVHTVTVEDSHAQEQLRQLTAQLEDLKRHTHVTRVILAKPDGTRETHETEDVRVERTSTAQMETTRHLDVSMAVKTDAIERVATQTTVTNSTPEWFVGPVFIVAPGRIGSGDPKAAMSAGILIGRRILGPLAVSLSATVPLNQPVQVPALGIAITMGF